MIVRYSPFLVGRDAELAQIKSAVDDVAQRGGGGTVRIAGHPGVGKSAPLRTGMEMATASGYTALSVRAAEGEAHLAFAALYQLLRPLLGRIDELPAGHRSALKSAFGLAEPGTGPDNRFFIALAALELIADAAAQTPVFVGVDDLSWLDEASLDAIEFISRRITDEQQAAAGNPLALLELAKVVGRSGRRCSSLRSRTATVCLRHTRRCADWPAIRTRTSICTRTPICAEPICTRSRDSGC